MQVGEDFHRLNEGELDLGMTIAILTVIVLLLRFSIEEFIQK